MGITVKENELFDEWSKKRDYLVRDGVVDEQVYQKEVLKIVFVLKEVNDKGGGGWDLREYLRDGARGATWNNIVRWTYGLNHYKKAEPWEAVKYINKKDRKEFLPSICAFNLKKTPGGRAAVDSIVAQVAREDKENLNIQFALYQPDVVICCGEIVSSTFYELIDLPTPVERKVTSNGVFYSEFSPGKFIIEYIHPQAIINAEILYRNLLDAYEEITGGNSPT